MKSPLLPGFVLSFLLMASAALAQEPSGVSSDLGAQRAAAEAGDSAAQFDLGNRYLAGDGVIADNFEAARWFQKAAEQDNNNAQYNLAIMYMQGTGVIADFSQALHWFHRAAELGDVPSQFTLATFYMNGRGVPQDPVQAHMWFTLAASGGHRAAAANLVLYQEMMSDEQIAEAQQAATAWIDNFNRNLATDAAVANPAARAP
ncbi:MAG: hypothetical protein A3H44_13990 [Gammaproteobacteria bacterium RIFCSPLOWO2_02_FULL_57_10]|nr:MAG: hypothetical protein A3H44_13990 [Gammaproteobacteria bacterium RIFCSPLOWO2_02_FULL_57_10]